MTKLLLILIGVACYAQQTYYLPLVPNTASTDTGYIGFRELRANGTHEVQLSGPDSLAATFRLRLPNSLPPTGGAPLFCLDTGYCDWTYSGAFVTMSTHQVSGLTGNKRWTGSHQFGGGVDVDSPFTVRNSSFLRFVDVDPSTSVFAIHRPSATGAGNAQRVILSSFTGLGTDSGRISTLSGNAGAENVTNSMSADGIDTNLGYRAAGVEVIDTSQRGYFSELIMNGAWRHTVISSGQDYRLASVGGQLELRVEVAGVSRTYWQFRGSLTPIAGTVGAQNGDIGRSGNPWRDGYFSGLITAANLTATSTVTGNIVNGNEFHAPASGGFFVSTGATDYVELTNGLLDFNTGTGSQKRVSMGGYDGPGPVVSYGGRLRLFKIDGITAKAGIGHLDNAQWESINGYSAGGFSVIDGSRNASFTGLTLSGSVGSDLLPAISGLYSLGNSSFKWANGQFSSSVNANGYQINGFQIVDSSRNATFANLTVSACTGCGTITNYLSTNTNQLSGNTGDKILNGQWTFLNTTFTRAITPTSDTSWALGTSSARWSDLRTFRETIGTSSSSRLENFLSGSSMTSSWIDVFGNANVFISGGQSGVPGVVRVNASGVFKAEMSGSTGFDTSVPYRVNGTNGLTQVLSVRNAAGTGSCTITLSLGIPIASTC